jgi:hypothetical protein
MTVADTSKIIFGSSIPYIGGIGAFFTWMAENGSGIVAIITIILMVWRFMLERKTILIKNKKLGE